jgi:hypothetical protein
VLSAVPGCDSVPLGTPGEDDNSTDPITVRLRNEANDGLNIHIYIESVGETVSGTSLTPGGSRNRELLYLQYHPEITFTAGRSANPVIHRKECHRVTDNLDPIVAWNGSTLECREW